MARPRWASCRLVAGEIHHPGQLPKVHAKAMGTSPAALCWQTEGAGMQHWRWRTQVREKAMARSSRAAGGIHEVEERQLARSHRTSSRAAGGIREVEEMQLAYPHRASPQAVEMQLACSHRAFSQVEEMQLGCSNRAKSNRA